MYSNGSSYNGKTPPPQLSATFVPGQEDNYLMPVVSPIPQRSMPEVPEQIQQNIAKLELSSGTMSPAIPSPKYGQPSNASQSSNQYPSQPGFIQSGLRDSPRASPRVSPRVSPNPAPHAGPNMPSQTLLSSEPFFPHIKNPPPNVPARAEETERVLESARQPVLNSNDPEMQVTWAQDTIAYVDSAMENNARLAEAGLGRSRTPIVEHQLRVDAVNVISFLADQHHPRAEFLRGTWLEFGKFGCEVDKPQAYRCFSTAARNGYARAQYRMGMQYEETGEMDKAIKHYELGLKAHDAASYYRFGMMYLLGQKGQPQDIQLGLEYIKYSADNADDNAPQGAYVYGMLLARELAQVSVPDQFLQKDLKQAKYYLEKAAYLGFSKAQTRIAAAYELQQLGYDFDPVYSLHYNLLAARQGEAEAEMAISKWFLSGYDGTFPKNEAVAYEYALRAAKSGFPTAEFALGYFNEVGIHVPSNLVEAKFWYGLAAEHGNEDAKGRITGISRSKTLSRKDHDNMALAKIKSVRGRPTDAAQQQNLQMPQVDTYRHPSPASPNRPTTNNVNDQYRQDSYNNQSQSPHPAYNNQNGRPSPAPYNSVPGPHGAYAQPIRATSTAYGLAPPQSGSPAMPYSNRQSSLPQGYRISSQGPPPNPAFARQNLPSPSQPAQSPNIASAPSTPNKTTYPADFGYSAPAVFSAADRRRIASAQASASMQPGSKPNSVAPNRKPMTAGQAPVSSSYPPKSESLQSKPALPNKASPATSTPPPKATAPSTAGKKPGKGPSTFAEMGIPQAKQDSDCILM